MPETQQPLHSQGAGSSARRVSASERASVLGGWGSSVGNAWSRWEGALPGQGAYSGGLLVRIPCGSVWQPRAAALCVATLHLHPFCARQVRSRIR